MPPWQLAVSKAVTACTQEKKLKHGWKKCSLMRALRLAPGAVWHPAAQPHEARCCPGLLQDAIHPSPRPDNSLHLRNWMGYNARKPAALAEDWLCGGRLIHCKRYVRTSSSADNAAKHQPPCSSTAAASRAALTAPTARRRGPLIVACWGTSVHTAGLRAKGPLSALHVSP